MGNEISTHGVSHLVSLYVYPHTHFVRTAIFRILFSDLNISIGIQSFESQLKVARARAREAPTTAD